MAIWVGAQDDCEVDTTAHKHTHAHTHTRRHDGFFFTGHVVHVQAGNGVYELTGFDKMHPGGPHAITRSCGKQVSKWGGTPGSAHAAYV